jgi:ankyrin repeat protein
MAVQANLQPSSRPVLHAVRLNHPPFLPCTDTEVIALLANSGADISASNSAHITPLHVATMRGHRDALKLLIGLGANVNASSAGGFTPLHCAIERAHADLVDDLIDSGCRIKNSHPLMVRIMCSFRTAQVPVH